MATAPDLPLLRAVDIGELVKLDVPTTKIRTDEDVVYWKRTRGYQDFGLFLRRLNESVVGHNYLTRNPWAMSERATTRMVALLDTLDGWIDEIPPLPTPQRFGNLAFRAWGKRLETEGEAVLAKLLPGTLQPAIPYLSPYLLTSFGSFTRMDYGTGHEASFALLLLSLTLLRFFEPEARTERELVLYVFQRYLRLCWRLQDVYNLEPAGSHGVWGLDDYSFLSYIFGSGQLRDQTEIPVNAILHPPLPPANLYFMSIMRIHEVKHGPFHEHSSQLYSIAVGVLSWFKVNSGLFKMYEAEVLGKRVVVQHIPLGGLLDWDNTVGPPSGQSQPFSTTPVTAPPPTSTSFASGTSIQSRSQTGFGAHSSTILPPLPTRRANPGSSRTVHGRPGFGDTRGILPGRLPLGPTASTALRPINAGAVGATTSPEGPSRSPTPTNRGSSQTQQGVGGT
ncbi:Phosphotyrosyl phosphatase activator [Fomitopsis serialis]|uniref:Phosphotyrosyl phosphatase activator n=1 Tax=Fomitopsis serialis TaxID=139415 RepID=UPI002007FFF1|nr:Phosphotyrosyl phosphatase activator [Neoantrodia serialis]KAH9917275.1 Phosphotyrosyl phosphatase activator [Neoantrodia serialis]